MSQETIKRTLRNFGLTEKEAEVYIFLAKRGVLKGGEISKQAKTQKALVYRILKSLQAKGLVESTLEFPARFTAVPFENVIDLNIQAKQEEAAQIAAQKRELLNYWQNIKKTEPELPLEKFQVIEGNQRIYHKLSQMMRETKNQLSAVMTAQGFARADQFGLFDVGSDHPLKSNIKFRFLTELSSQDIRTVRKIVKTVTDAKIDFEGRTPELGSDVLPQMTIKDQEEAVFFITPQADTTYGREDYVCLWTDCKSLVKAFTAVFDEQWRNSTDIYEKITEIETNRLAPKTLIIADADMAKKKYNEAMQSAKEEILTITSSKGLLEFWKSMSQLNEWVKRGVKVKIMAPIVNENIEAAEQLSRLCSVKHVQPNYLQTTVIDGKHIFQFKPPISKNQSFDSSLHFENTLYTNNPEHVKKMRDMLHEHWKNSRPPSADNLKSIIGTHIRNVALFPGAIRGPGPYGSFYPSSPDPVKESNYTVFEIVDEDPYGKLTEQDVLNEIMKAQKDSLGDLAWIYSSQAAAIVRPPDFFNLQPMLIRVHHVEKHSEWGEEDVIAISLWLETPNGEAFVPVAVLGDNSKAQVMWKSLFAASPAGQNIRLAKKDELQIRVHGNTLFAGWTVPIPLFPSKYVLPPACMLVEGYGEIKTSAYSIIKPSGARFTAKQNGLDAFVTFMHPSSKYSGPGTDGFFVRDFVASFPLKSFKGRHQTLEHRLIEKRTYKQPY